MHLRVNCTKYVIFYAFLYIYIANFVTYQLLVVDTQYVKQNKFF